VDTGFGERPAQQVLVCFLFFLNNDNDDENKILDRAPEVHGIEVSTTKY